MKRTIIKRLAKWKDQKNRKPLIIKGVRQVGKTYILEMFGKEYFPAYHYLNFEQEHGLAKIFERDLNPHRIIDELSFHLSTAINPETDLVIFDEIQACPIALTSLKYFQEKMPQLALCSAGSLLGVHLNANSYPVGKVDILKMYPMSFEEFLMGIGDDKSVKILQQLTAKSEIAALVHEHLWERLKLYFIIGGLPEVVTTYCQHQENSYLALQEVRKKQKDLIQAYYADMAKHSGKVNAMHIDRLWRAIPTQLARTQDGSAPKFKFKDVIPGVDRYSRMVDVLDWLDAAGLILKSYIVESPQVPLAAMIKESMFKLYIFDVGILGAMIDLSPKVILDYTYGTYKGYFAENFAAQAFVSMGNEALYSWAMGNSEVEFLKEMDNDIIPIEIKSGMITQAKSLKVYAQKYQPKYRVIMSAKELYIDNERHIHHYPLYLAAQFPLEEVDEAN